MQCICDFLVGKLRHSHRNMKKVASEDLQYKQKPSIAPRDKKPPVAEMESSHWHYQQEAHCHLFVVISCDNL